MDGEYVAYLFVDLHAFDVLAAEEECRAADINVPMRGYESYMVEQWACERKLNTVVTSFTGNQRNEIIVAVLQVPNNREMWGPQVTNYFDDLSNLHLLPKETPLGVIFVTNLASLPSNWTLMPMTDPYEQSRQLFLINENLRRFNCVGRLGLSLEPPPDSAASKFREMLRTAPQVPLEFAVREVVTLLQISLFYFDLLQPHYVDGLYCNYTVGAVNQWWQKFGQPRYKIVPDVNSKTFQATTVAAIIGYVVGVRNRLTLLSSKAPKDPFNADQFVYAIRHFQKAERLPKIMRIDEATARRLFEVTAKYATNGPDLFAMVKATMKESISGKVSSKNDPETSNIEILKHNVKGNRARYLWQDRGTQYITVEALFSMDPDVYSPVTGIPLSSLADDDKGARRSARQSSLVTKFRRRQPEVAVLNGVRASSTGLPGPKHGGKKSVDLRSIPHTHTADPMDRPSHGVADDPAGPVDSPVEDKHYDYLTRTKLLTKDDLAVVERDPPCVRNAGLRRCTSLSNVQKVVFPWAFPVPLPRMIKLYQQACGLRKELVLQMGEDEQYSQQIKRQIQDQSMKLSTEYRYSDAIKFEVSASARKEHAVLAQLKDLEAFTAKIDYEWSFLDRKLKQVEATIDTFASKVDSIEKRCAKLDLKPRDSLWQRLVSLFTI